MTELETFLLQDLNIDEECLLFSEEQVDELLQGVGGDSDTESPSDEAVQKGGKKDSQHRRKKRSFTTEQQRWSNPLLYKFDGAHCEYNKLNCEYNKLKSYFMLNIGIM